MHFSGRGFTLLEAIVALAVLSAGLLAAFAWFQQGIQALIKVDNWALEEPVLLEAVERLRLEDFNERASGNYQWRDYRVDWRADLLEPAKEGVNSLGSTGYFDVFLYRVSLDLFFNDRLIAQPSVILTKSKQVRAPPNVY